MKKSLTFIVAAFCLCAFVNKANAQFSGGDGSENSPYIIKTAQELAQLATFVNDGKPYFFSDNLSRIKN
jgi:hypothetical protein